MSIEVHARIEQAVNRATALPAGTHRHRVDVKLTIGDL